MADFAVQLRLDHFQQRTFSLSSVVIRLIRHRAVLTLVATQMLIKTKWSKHTEKNYYAFLFFVCGIRTLPFFFFFCGFIITCFSIDQMKCDIHLKPPCKTVRNSFFRLLQRINITGGVEQQTIFC